MPEEALLALKMAPEGLGDTLKLAAAVKLYGLGRLSSGAAAALAGIPKPLFLSKLADYGVVTFRLGEEGTEGILKMPEVICNTSPVQYLHQVRLLPILHEMYGRVGSFPRRKYLGTRCRAKSRDMSSRREITIEWFSVRGVREGNLLKMVSGLGAGEKEVLALPLRTRNRWLSWTISWPDAMPLFLNIRFTGTLGVLLKAKERGYSMLWRPFSIIWKLFNSVLIRRRGKQC